MGATNNRECECGRLTGKSRTGEGRLICDRCAKLEEQMRFKTGGRHMGLGDGGLRVRVSLGLEPYRLHLPGAAR